MLQLHAIRFAAREILHRLSIYERDVVQIQNQSAIDGLWSTDALQFAQVFRLDSTA
jgi:hypothetical protein